MLRESLRITVLFLALTLCLPLTALAQGGLRYTIMISEFKNESACPSQLGRSWETIMADVLQQTGKFIVVAGNMRDDAIEEQVNAQSGMMVQGAKSPVMGQLTPAQLLVKGTITNCQQGSSGKKGKFRVKGLRVGGGKTTTEIRATIQMVDSTTAQVLASKSVVGRAESKGGKFSFSSRDLDAGLSRSQKSNLETTLRRAIKQGVDWMVERVPQIPWRGSVVAVEDDKVTINRGAREGIIPGMTFSVGEAKPMRDPATGEVLDISVKEFAQIKADRVGERVTICSVISGDETVIYELMGVRLLDDCSDGMCL